MENVDPVGVHTGDSIVVAPILTLNRDNGLANALAEFFEQLSVLGALDAFAACTQQLYLTFVQYAFPRHSHSAAQAAALRKTNVNWWIS